MIAMIIRMFKLEIPECLILTETTKDNKLYQLHKIKAKGGLVI